LTFALLVVAGVDQDAAQPGSEAGLSLKVIDAAVELEKRFLHGVLGVGSIAEELTGDALKSRAMVMKNLFKRSDLTPAAGCQQLAFVGVFPVVRGLNQRCQARFDHFL